MSFTITSNAPKEGRIPFPPSQGEVGLALAWALLDNALLSLGRALAVMAVEIVDAIPTLCRYPQFATSTAQS